jgi:2-desacetyl-2-hydroxyethyl bacteriochlorophyllide A dehydrogenase
MNKQVMRALWLEQQRLTFRENVPIPVPDKSQVLIRVLFSGICSTDLELLRGYYPFTGIPGHEFVGEVVSSADDESWIGARVVGEINISCGQCATCKSGLERHCEYRKTLGIHDWDGTFAEYLILPMTNLHKIPEGVSNEKAIFTEPIAAAHEILEQTTIDESERVLIIGAGRLGLLTAMVIHQTGCELDVVVRHKKQQAILENCNIQAINEVDIGSKKYDVVVEATGSVEGFTQACKSIRPRGRIILKSTYKGNSEVNFSQIVVDEVCLIGSRCGSFDPALRLLAEGKVDPLPLIEAVYPLEQGIRAFDLAARSGVLKVLIKTVQEM